MTDSRVDRLPWLDDPAPAAVPEPRARGRRAGLVALILLLVAAIGVGAFWLGQYSEKPVAAVPVAPPSRPPAPRPTVPRPTVPIPAEPAPAPERAERPASRPASRPTRRARPAHRPHRLAHRPRHAKIHTPAMGRARYRQVVARQHAEAAAESARAPVPAQRATWYPIPLRAGPPGRAIQLGAYLSQRDAQAAWRAILTRWPYLGTRPLLILPTPARAGRRMLWRIQLRTDSQAQSLVICQRLRATGQSCMLVY